MASAKDIFFARENEITINCFSEEFEYERKRNSHVC